QSRVVVVNRAQRQDLLLEPRSLLEDRIGTRRIEIDRSATRYDPVHQEAMAEKARVQAQQVLLEARELREPECEAAVVAEIAEIAEMVGDALALEQQRPQPQAALWRHRPRSRLERHRVGPGVPDGAVARDPAGETRPIGEAH